MDLSENALLDSTLDLVGFFDILSGDLQNQIDYLAKDLEKSCLDNPTIEVLHTGSGFEQLALPHLETPKELPSWNTDADHMLIRKDIEVFDCSEYQTTGNDEVILSEHVGGENTANIMYIYQALHKGYVYVSPKKLQNPADSGYVQEHCLKNTEFVENNKDLVRFGSKAIMAKERTVLTGPSISLPYIGGTHQVHRDMVYSLKCKFWPLLAKEWLSRERQYSWPKRGLISAIVAQGCHIVPVGSHTSGLRAFEWRLSFSLAELMLIQSLTKNQRLAYSILKALIKSEMKYRGIEVFASYHLKTALLWLLEQKGVELWMQRSLRNNILELLDFLIGLYADGYLPNYFVPKNDMIDHRSQDEVSRTCAVLRDIRENMTMSLCRYVETNQALPVLFDKPLTQILKENTEKFVQICKYNFLLMALVDILKCLKTGSNASSNWKARYLINKALLVHTASKQGYNRSADQLPVSQDDDCAESSSAKTVLSILEDFLAADQLKVTESSAVTLAVFNVFLALHPTSLDKTGHERDSPEFYSYHTIPEFKDCLFWAARQHEKYSDAIFDFVVKKWSGGPQFRTEDQDARRVMKLLMVILGKPTKQACAVNGALTKRSIEGQRFLLMRSLADYLLLVHPESAYVTFQASAYLMDQPVISEINLVIKWSYDKQKKLRAQELILCKAELQAQ